MLVHIILYVKRLTQNKRKCKEVGRAIYAPLFLKEKKKNGLRPRGDHIIIIQPEKKRLSSPPPNSRTLECRRRRTRKKRAGAAPLFYADSRLVSLRIMRDSASFARAAMERSLPPSHAPLTSAKPASSRPASNCAT